MRRKENDKHINKQKKVVNYQVQQVTKDKMRDTAIQRRFELDEQEICEMSRNT